MNSLSLFKGDALNLTGAFPHAAVAAGCSLADLGDYNAAYDWLSAWLVVHTPSEVCARVRNVALEILSNVYDHATVAGRCSVTVLCHAGHAGVEVMVEDNGRGITIEQFARLQTRFGGTCPSWRLHTTVFMQPERLTGTRIHLAFDWSATFAR